MNYCKLILNVIATREIQEKYIGNLIWIARHWIKQKEVNRKWGKWENTYSCSIARKEVHISTMLAHEPTFLIRNSDWTANFLGRPSVWVAPLLKLHFHLSFLPAWPLAKVGMFNLHLELLRFEALQATADSGLGSSTLRLCNTL